jgi:hypothetical protein
MTDIIDPNVLLLAAQEGSARALLEPDVERLVGEAMRTLNPAKLKAARTALALELAECNRARRAQPPRLVELRKLVAEALRHRHTAAPLPPPKCPHCGQTMKGGR